MSHWMTSGAQRLKAKQKSKQGRYVRVSNSEHVSKNTRENFSTECCRQELTAGKNTTSIQEEIPGRSIEEVFTPNYLGARKGSRKMDHINFPHGSGNRKLQSPSGAGQSQHPLNATAGAGLLPFEPSIESLAAMRQLLAQQNARQVGVGRGGLEQLNANLDIGALGNHAALAQLQAKASHEAAAEYAAQIATRARANDSTSISDPLQQRQLLLQQQALLRQQQQVEAFLRSNPQPNQNALFQDTMQLQEEVQLLELLRVREDLILHKQKQEEGLKAAAAVAAAAQHHNQHPQNFLSNMQELERLQTLRQMNFPSGGSAPSVGLGASPLNTAAALGVLGQRQLHDLNVLQQHQQQQQLARAQAVSEEGTKLNSGSKVFVGSRQNSANIDNEPSSRNLSGVPLLPKFGNIEGKKSPVPSQVKESTKDSQQRNPVLPTSKTSRYAPKPRKQSVPSNSNVGNSKSKVVGKGSNGKTGYVDLTEEVNNGRYMDNQKNEDEAYKKSIIEQLSSLKSSQSIPQTKLQEGNGGLAGLMERMRQGAQSNKKINNQESVVSSAQVVAPTVSVEQQNLRYFNNGLETNAEGSPMKKTIMKNVADNFQVGTETVSSQINPKGLKAQVKIPQIPLCEENKKANTNMSRTTKTFNPAAKPSKVPTVQKKNTQPKKKKNPKTPKSLSVQLPQHPKETKKRKSSDSKAGNPNQPDPKISKTMRRAKSQSSPQIVPPGSGGRKDTNLSTSNGTVKAEIMPSLKSAINQVSSKSSYLPQAQFSTKTETTRKKRSNSSKTAPKNGATKKFIPGVSLKSESKIDEKKIKGANQVQNVVKKENSQPPKKVESTETSPLAQNCTRYEFFAFVIKRVPELASTVAIIHERHKNCNDSHQTTVPKKVVDSILGELYHMTNVDLMDNTMNGKSKAQRQPSFCDQLKLRINRCINEIEAWKNSWVKAANLVVAPKKKSTEASVAVPAPLPAPAPTPAPVALSAPALKQEHEKNKLYVPDHKKTPRAGGATMPVPNVHNAKGLQLEKPWKSVRQLKELEARQKKMWDLFGEKENESSLQVQMQQHPPHVAITQTKVKNTPEVPKTSISVGGPHADLIKDIYNKERGQYEEIDEDSVNEEEQEQEDSAMSAARALLNFGAK